MSTHTFLIILGAGAGGMIQAAEILRAKALPAGEIMILERSEDFGGVWLTNKYPGCACDTPIRTYEVSWKRNPDWSNVYAPQPEILAYWHTIAEEYELAKITKFRTDVLKAEWIEPDMRWRVETRDVDSGEVALISATGMFNNPEIPPIPGFDTYSGRHIYPGRWPAGLENELTGKRVAVIGTGPSAVQIIPEIAEKVERLTVYQRSPGHVLPRGDNRYREITKKILRIFPGLLWIYGKWSVFIFEIMVKMVCKLPTFVSRKAGKEAKKYALEHVKTPEKQEQLIPKGEYGFRRPMFSDFYYDTMSLDTVDLITTPITSLSPTSILTATTETPVDLIIWATGYDLTNPPIPIIGRNSIPLSTSSGPQHLTLYGSSFSNVPNYGTLTGPHLGSFWIPPLEMYETISKYHIQIIRRLRELGKGSAVMPLREREEEWVASLAKGREEVPNVNEGCGTYYKLPDDTLAMYPYSRSRMKGMFKNVNWERDWEVLSRRSEGEVEVERSGKGERRFRLFKGAGRLSGSSGSSGKGVYDEERGGSVRKIVVSDETRVV